MAGKKQLPPVRLVTDEETSESRKDTETSAASELSLTDAITDGTRLDELKAMRRILVAHMENENTLARDLAALTRQVREISKEIEGLELQEAEREKQEAEDGGADYGVTDAEWKPTAI